MGGPYASVVRSGLCWPRGKKTGAIYCPTASLTVPFVGTVKLDFFFHKLK